MTVVWTGGAGREGDDVDDRGTGHVGDLPHDRGHRARTPDDCDGGEEHDQQPQHAPGRRRRRRRRRGGTGGEQAPSRRHEAECRCGRRPCPGRRVGDGVLVLDLAAASLPGSRPCVSASCLARLGSCSPAAASAQVKALALNSAGPHLRAARRVDGAELAAQPGVVEERSTSRAPWARAGSAVRGGSASPAVAGVDGWRWRGDGLVEEGGDPGGVLRDAGDDGEDQHGPCRRPTSRRRGGPRRSRQSSSAATPSSAAPPQGLQIESCSRWVTVATTSSSGAMYCAGCATLLCSPLVGGREPDRP